MVTDKPHDAETKKLYSYTLDYGRMGYLDGVFVTTDSEIEACKGKTAYFGEALGKHSEVYDENFVENIKFLTDDAEFIAKAEKYGIIPTGSNPISQILFP